MNEIHKGLNFANFSINTTEYMEAVSVFVTWK
jgi:hypothetical protein